MSRQSNDFKKLKDKWYKKLEQNGFEDIELSHRDSLIRWHHADFQYFYSPESFRQKEYYFYLANQFLNQYQFESEVEKKIWQLHSEGMGCREIYRKTRWKSKSTIHLVICKLKQIMKAYY